MTLIILLVFLMLMAYIFTVLFKMKKTHNHIDDIHREFKLYRKKLYRNVRPIFCSNEAEYTQLVEKTKKEMKHSKELEKTLPKSKMVWLSPFSLNPEKFITNELKSHLLLIRDFKEKEIS